MNKIAFFITIFSVNLFSQSKTIAIESNYINPYGQHTDLVSFSPIFKLDDNQLHNKNQNLKIKHLPNSFNSEKAAYAFIYFNGAHNSSFTSEIPLLIENYDAALPKIYVDSNGNLDFTDDGVPLILNKELTLKLSNSNISSGVLHYKISKNNINPNAENRFISRYASQYPNNQILSTKFWLAKQRLNTKITTTFLNKKPITIFLFDNDADGIFTFNTGDYSDRIYITEGHINYNNEVLEYNRTGESIDHNAVFNLYGKNYFIEKINHDASNITINTTDKKPKPKLKTGTNVSSFKIELLDGTRTTIKELTKNNKPLLIDLGGTWCGGCIAQEPDIKKIYNQELVNVIGVFGYDTKTSVTNYIRKHDIKWPVALMSDSFKTLFNTTSYPTYILISPKGDILLIELLAKKIVKYLTKV